MQISCQSRGISRHTCSTTARRAPIRARRAHADAADAPGALAPDRRQQQWPAAVLVCPGFLADSRGPECTELAASLRRHFHAHPEPGAPAAEGASGADPGAARAGGGSGDGAVPGPGSGAPPPAVAVLPVKRSDWWPTLRGASFAFYTDALAAAVRELAGDSSSSGSGGGGRGRVALVCLSAAGWIARLALGDKPYEGGGAGRAVACGAWGC